MSIGPMHLAAGMAGSPLAQAANSEVERAQLSAAQKLRAQADANAEMAAGVGETDGEEHGTNERDADGRRLWEAPPTPRHHSAAPTADLPHLSKDPTGEAGQTLDLNG